MFIHNEFHINIPTRIRIYYIKVILTLIFLHYYYLPKNTLNSIVLI
jgi:hypothetical protein